MDPFSNFWKPNPKSGSGKFIPRKTLKSEIRSVLNCLHNILRCLFFGLPKPGGRDDLRSGPGPLILPTLLPKIYASLQGMNHIV